MTQRNDTVPHETPPARRSVTNGCRPLRGAAGARSGPVAWTFALWMAALLAATVQAQDSAPIERSASGEVTLNLRDSDIRAFIGSVSELTGRNFVVDPRVKGLVTVISSVPTDAETLYEVFLSVLKVHGFAAIDSGDVVKIVPDATGKQELANDVIGVPQKRTDQLMTSVLKLDHILATELVPVLRPLLPQEAHLAALAEANALIVADSASNIERIAQIVERIDVESSFELELVLLKHADPDEIVATLMNLTGGEAPKGKAQRQRFIAIPRSSSILMSAPDNARLRYRALITQLDVPDREPDDVVVIPLRFASAPDLVSVLQSVASTPALPGSGAAGDQPGAGPGRGVTIQADEATNTLILQAPPRALRTLQAVVEKLDVRRAQVLVEGIIAEVTTQRTNELGVQWKTNLPDDGIVAGTSFPGVASGSIDSPFDLTDGIGFGSGLTLGVLRGSDIRLLLRALSGDRYTNVLSTPTLMTLDNAEAEIVVGQNVPFVTGQFTNDATTPDNPFQTIERQDVGVLLKVKPQINEGDAITLEIRQEVSSVAAGTTGANLVTNKRSITTTVLVDDSEIVVLGGLIEDDLDETEQKIPVLGDIPLIGKLFKTTQDDFTKTNLMVFLRPTVIRDRARSRDVSGDRYDYIRKQQEKAEDSTDPLKIRKPAPQLPPLDGLLD